jgi:TonB family protein
MNAPILFPPRATLPLARASRGRRRRGPMLVVSAAIHLAILAALILIFRHEAPQEEPAPQGVAMVFEPSAAEHGQQTEIPRPGLPEAPKPGAMPTPTAPPVPDATEVPAPPPPPPPPPASPDTQVNIQPPPPVPAPALPEAPAAPDVPAPPAAAAQNPDTAELPIPPPPPAAPPAPRSSPGSTQQQAALVPPLPHPPPLRAPPAQTQPRPARPAQPSPPRRLAFPAPMNFSLGQASPTASRAAPSIYSPQPPSADGPPGAGARTAAGMLETFARAREGNPGPDFYAALRAWWLAHRFYPEQAAERGEDGDVQLSLIVDRQGRVLEVQIETRSGSQWLDMAGKSVWENARLAPIPDSLGRDRLTVDLTLHYMLIRR